MPLQSQASPGISIRMIDHSSYRYATSALSTGSQAEESSILTASRFSARKFFRDTISRQYLHRSTTIPASPPSDTPFRFMDLPAKLRLLIAEYVLAVGKPLFWHWINLSPTNRTGTFSDTDKHTGLYRASRQLHAELNSTFWKVNVFVFNAFRIDFMRIPSRSNEPEASPEIFEACRLFVRGAGPSVTSSLRAVQVKIGFNEMLRADGVSPVLQLSELAGLLPQACLTVLDPTWAMTTWISHNDHKLAVFLERGREIERAVVGKLRTWTNFPIVLVEDHQWLLSQSSGESIVAEVLGWIENGI